MDRDRLVNGGIDRSFVERRAGYRIAERNIQYTDDRNLFERNRSSRNDGIYSYRPSERENIRDTEKFDIKRGEKRTSLERDKIVISRESNREIRRDRIDGSIGRDKPDNRPEKRQEINREMDESIRDKREIRSNDSRIEREAPRREPEMNRSGEGKIKREDKSERKNETRVDREKPKDHNTVSSRSSEKKESRSEQSSRPDRKNPEKSRR